MGNLPSKRGEGDVHQINNMQSSQDEPNMTNIDITSIQDKIEPLAVFGVQDMNRSQLIAFLQSNELTKRYKMLMMQHHPDRGGNPLKSAIINYSYEKLKVARENILSFDQHTTRDQEDLRTEYMETQMESKKIDEKEVKKAMQKILKGDQKNFQKKFNEVFEMSKLSDYTDDGYEIDNRTTKTRRDPISVRRVNGVTTSNMNEMFEKNTTVNNALIVHKKKQPEGISSLKHAVYEYGKKKEDDYGRMTKGASDYHMAYAGERLVDFESARPKDKVLTGKVSVSMAKSARSTQNLRPEMTEEERELWAEQQESLEREEAERKANMVEMDYLQSKRQNLFIERMITYSESI